MTIVSLGVTGMTCAGCEQHVIGALATAGAQRVEADWRAGEARFDLPQDVGEPAVRAAVQQAGYQPGALREVSEVAPQPSGAPAVDGPADYDLVVVGAGSAAFAAAIRARDAGHSVALVEAGTLGGTCVNVGCVPSKTLLRAGELRAQAATIPFAGVDTAVGEVNMAALVAQKDELVDALRQAKYADLVDDYQIEVIAGHGRFADGDTLIVAGQAITARAFLVATGSSPWAPPIPGLAEAGYLTSTTALDLKEIPARLAIIGSGAVGLELGQLFAHLGSDVTFIDVAERIACFEEPEASRALTDALEGEGATVVTSVQVRQVDCDGDVRRLTVDARDGERIVEADEVLVATGRRPATAELGLEAAGVETDRAGGIVVDDRLRTTSPRIWAAGDVVAGATQFVYVSAYHGSLAADNALAGADRSVDYTGLPRVTFTAPPIAGAGLTEAQARQHGHAVKTSVLDLEHVPRALANRDTRGVIKLVADADTDRLLGATVVAEAAGEVIQTAVLAIRARITTAELAATFHPYLTMAEGLKLAAQTFDRDVAKLSCCAA